MRWWGWGEDERAPAVPGAALAQLRERLGADAENPPVALEEVRLPERGLPGRARERLQAVLGREHVREDREARISHAVGRSYADLVRLRSGDATNAPDAVLYPGSAKEVGGVLSAAS